MDTITSIADHAAQQSDRWLFVAMLSVFLVTILLLARWFIADRSKMSDRLTAVTDRHIAQGEALAQVVANNTIAITRNTEVLEYCRRTRTA